MYRIPLSISVPTSLYILCMSLSLSLSVKLDTVPDCSLGTFVPDVDQMRKLFPPNRRLCYLAVIVVVVVLLYCWTVDVCCVALVARN